ncbi:MAG: 2-C-methyl-D-erythritol 4-phosphate cytidylyltransferase [Deltaproteobacteria bacterium]|nr:2-C-methyl-D-erythritol 4-phosphate cytidylyltransferase [Deltaproteobacteria bacterium]
MNSPAHHSSPLINAVIVAAGKGERMGTLLPKPFLALAGVPLLIHTVRNLLRSPLITKLVIVVAAEREVFLQDLLERYGPFSVPIGLVHGGRERQDSVRLGLAALDPACEVVVIHDAARPFIAAEIVDRSVAAAVEVGGALVAIPVKDTLKQVDEDNTVLATVPRQSLWLAQTPQTFRVQLIREAHARAVSEGIIATDDAALLERIGAQVKVVRGDPLNFKITTPDDLRLAEAILLKGLGARC